VVTASLLGLSAIPAQADVGDVWGFGYADNPAPPAFFVPMDPGHSATKSGGAVEYRSVGYGRYEVRFEKTAVKSGVPHVTAVSKDPRWCQIDTWKPNWSDGYEHVWVNCYKEDGFTVDTEFTVVFTGSTDPAPVSPDKHAYAFVSSAGTVLDQFNPDGAILAGGGGGGGLYKVHLPMPGPGVASGNFQVTAVNHKPARCKVEEWYPDIWGQTVLVQCYNNDNKPYDTGFTLSYNRGRPVVAAYGPPKHFGYTWITPALPPDTNFNSLGAVNSVSFGPGLYEVVMPHIGIRANHAQVTAFGKGPAYCGLQTLWTEDFFGNARIRNVICFSGAGPLAKSDSFLAYTSQH
jgi:hypothetical protein